MGWVVVYGDRSLYEGSAWDAPAVNVQAVIIEDPDHGWEALYGGQGFYIYDPLVDTWRMAEDMFALHDYLIAPGPKRVLFGRTLAREEWQELRRWVNDLVGEKTGQWPDERRA